MKKNKVWKPFFGFYARIRIPWLFYIGAAILGMLAAETALQVSAFTIQVNQGELYNSVILGYALVSVATALLGAFGNVLSEYASGRVTFRGQSMLWNKILRLWQKDVDREGPSSLISSVTNEAAEASSSLLLIFHMAASLYAFTRALVRMFSFHAGLTGYILLATPLAVLMFFLVGRTEYYGMRKQFEALGEMTAWFSEHLSCAKYVKTQAMEEEEVKAGLEVIEKRYRSELIYEVLGEVQVLLNSLYTNVVTVIIAVGGSRLIRGGRMEQTGINTASTYMGKVNQYQAELLTQYQRVKGTQGALRHANGLLSLEEENREAGDGEMVCKDLVFDHVSFSFDGSRPILRDATFTIPQGKRTALIGKNGSGKSTVFKLLQGFYRPDAGRILINGRDLADVKLSELRKQFAYVLQNTPLLSGTIRENIAYGCSGEVGEEQIIRAAKLADAHEFILEQREGYDTQVGEGGMNLSGGQRQRIALARAMILAPPYLLLDEATASLDHRSAGRIGACVRKAETLDTVVFISHNREEIVSADYVIVMKDGRTAAAGTPKELEENPDYLALTSLKYGEVPV